MKTISKNLYDPRQITKKIFANDLLLALLDARPDGDLTFTYEELEKIIKQTLKLNRS